MRHGEGRKESEGRKERKADEEIKGGHSANELVRSPREWE